MKKSQTKPPSQETEEVLYCHSCIENLENWTKGKWMLPFIWQWCLKSENNWFDSYKLTYASCYLPALSPAMMHSASLFLFSELLQHVGKQEHDFLFLLPKNFYVSSSSTLICRIVRIPLPQFKELSEKSQMMHQGCWRPYMWILCVVVFQRGCRTSESLKEKQHN